MVKVVIAGGSIRRRDRHAVGVERCGEWERGTVKVSLFPPDQDMIHVAIE